MKYEGVDSGYTASGGIPTLMDLFMRSESFDRLKSCLPERRSNYSFQSEQFGLALLAGFLKGYDCLDDLDELQWDAAVLQKIKEIPTARTMGNFLRDFSDEHRAEFNALLSQQALEARQRLTKDLPLVIDMDSTSHVHRGKKIEGLAYNYKNEWCLDSLLAFDELGLCHGMDLRSGNTFSSQGAPEMIIRILSPLEHRRKKFFRADSAFCNEDVVQACLKVGAIFTLTAHRNIGWEETVKSGEIQSWTPWRYSDQEKKAAELSGVSLPRVELGSFLYQPGWNDGLRFQVVVKRTWSKNHHSGQHEWRYYAVLTNWNLFYSSAQEVMTFHHKRGNSENFIREGKYGYDLKHFPCKKMNANHAYGLFALLVHNFLRILAILDNPSNPHFSKKIRRKYIFIPGRVTFSARTWTIKIPKTYMKEVDRLNHAWAAAFNPALARAG